MISNCKVCNCRSAIYKCSICRIPFCSADCYKSHKLTDTCIRKAPIHVLEDCHEADQRFETVDSVAPEELEKLAGCTELRELLKDQEIRDMLSTVDKSSDGAAAVRQMMSSLKFQEFVHHCLALVTKAS